MASCKVCGKPAGFMMSRCESCQSEQVNATAVELGVPSTSTPRVHQHVNDEGEIQCVKCGSTQLHTGARGYSFMRGGIFGSGQVIITCLKCGHKFLPGGKPY
jgi:ribosomal protein S27E